MYDHDLGLMIFAPCADDLAAKPADLRNGSVLETAGPFDERLDAGTPTRSGGDHEMFSRLLATGHRIVYDPAAVSRHHGPRGWSVCTRSAVDQPRASKPQPPHVSPLSTAA